MTLLLSDTFVLPITHK